MKYKGTKNSFINFALTKSKNMKKIFIAIAVCTSQLAFAQSVDSYILKVQTGQSYTPLTTGTNISSGLLWDEESFKVPMGFTSKIGDKTIDSFSLINSGGFGPASDTTGLINAFMAIAATDLEDRGWISGTPSSPLRYLVSGVAPNRIFKFEMFNAGFYEEQDIYGTLNDSLNLQMWVYETTNIIELRFGDSKITNPTDYFYLGTSTLVGYIKNADMLADTLNKGYNLTGSPSAPIVDSFTAASTSITVMNAFPTSGTVYRFIPKTVAAGLGDPDFVAQFKVYPTQTTDFINIDYAQTEKAQAELMNVNGQKVLPTSSLNKGKNTIAVSSLPNGNYILNINSTTGTASFKFTKQ